MLGAPVRRLSGREHAIVASPAKALEDALTCQCWQQHDDVPRCAGRKGGVLSCAQHATRLQEEGQMARGCLIKRDVDQTAASNRVLGQHARLGSQVAHRIGAAAAQCAARRERT
jgi:hypothetical protein